jgi:hypothetical protein
LRRRHALVINPERGNGFPRARRIAAEDTTEGFMSGISPISSQISGLAAVFQARANIPAFLRAQNDYNQASHVLANPPSSFALNRQIRDLRHQSGDIQGFVNQNTEFEDRLNTLVSGLNTINTSLTSIQALVNNTIAVPGNAAANQAQITTLVSTVKTEVANLRALQSNSTFQFTGLDSRISDLALFSADGSRIDANGINIDINVTDDARRAEIFTFLDQYHLTDALTRIFVTGPGGTSALINLDPTAGQINSAIKNVDLNNTEAVTFQIFGGVHAGTGVNYSAPQTISTVAGTTASITDAIIGINSALNYGNATVSIDTETSAVTNLVISGGTQANNANAITGISPTLNTGSTTFTLGGVKNFGGTTGTANITVNGGTQAAAATSITGISSTFHANNNVTIAVTGGIGTSNVTVNRGGRGTITNALTGITGAQGANTFTITGAINGAGGTANVVVNLAANVNQATAVANINAAIAGSGLNTFVTALANGASGINLRANNDGTAATVQIATGAGANSSNQSAAGTNGDSQATIIANINAVSAATGVKAAASGGTSIQLTANNGTSNLFGSSSRVQTTVSGGAGQIVTVAAVNNTGTAGDNQATIIANINAQNANTGVFASANGANIRLISQIGGLNSFGSSTNVTISAAAGGTAATVSNGVTSGTAGDTQANVITNINALRVGGTNLGLIASAGSASDKVTLTTSSVGTTGIGQFDDDGIAGTGTVETITVANVSQPNAASARVGATVNATGTNSTSQAGLIALINAVTGSTKINATASGSFNITLASTLLGVGADVNIKPTVNPENTAYVAGSVYPAAAAVNNEDISFNVAVGATQTSLGTVLGQTTAANIRTAAINAINTGANSIGVEAYIDAVDGTGDVSLRTFLYGGAFKVSVNTSAGGATVDANTVQANPSDIGEHAIATISIDGGVAETLSSTNPGNNPASGSGGTYAFGVDGVSVNQFSFETNGVVGHFSVPVDTIFDPSAVTVTPDTSLFLPLEDAFGNFLTRFNFNALNDNFLGDFVLDRANTATRGRTGAVGTTVLNGGIAAINVQTSTTAATAIITQALADVATDLSTASSLLTNVIDPQITSDQSRITALDASVATLETYNDAIATAAETEADATITNASTVLAQLATLFPIATGPLLS